MFANFHIKWEKIHVSFIPSFFFLKHLVIVSFKKYFKDIQYLNEKKSYSILPLCGCNNTETLFPE